MEMAVKGLSQSEISPKKIHDPEIVEDGEEDRISALPDCLILEILSRLPSVKYAITTGTLSKRWIHLWTSVPSLIFLYDDHNLTWYDLVSIVDKTLTQCRQLKLKKFELYTLCNIQCGSQVNNWINYAIRRNVEELNLMLWSIEDEFLLDQSFFINTCFTDLTLLGCVLNPAGAISWKHLSRLCIFFGKLDEDLVENILSGSPVLETLVLDHCHGYRHLDIKSKSIKNLVLNNCYGCGQLNGVEITAPNILSLTIKGDLWLRKLLLGNMSSLIEANLNYINLGYEETDYKEVEEEILKGHILNLRHVKELIIGVKCSEVLARLEAKGFVLPSNMVL